MRICRHEEDICVNRHADGTLAPIQKKTLNPHNKRGFLWGFDRRRSRPHPERNQDRDTKALQRSGPRVSVRRRSTADHLNGCAVDYCDAAAYPDGDNWENRVQGHSVSGRLLLRNVEVDEDALDAELRGAVEAELRYERSEGGEIWKITWPGFAVIGHMRAGLAPVRY